MALRSTEVERLWRAYANELATNLQRARQERGLSQEEVASRAGVTRYTYQKYEKGESKPGAPANPTIRTALALSQVLDVPLIDLLPQPVPDLRAR